MDEHAAWNGWLLRHGRLAAALFMGAIWLGFLFLPAAVDLLLGTPGNWWVVLGASIGVAGTIIGGSYLLGRGHPASDESLPWTAKSPGRRLLIALGLALFAGLLAALTTPIVPFWEGQFSDVRVPPPDLALRLLAGGLSALWTGACVLALVPLGPPPPRPAPPLPWTGERIMGVGVLLLGVAVLRFAAVGFRFLGPPPFDPSFLLGIIGGALLWGGLARWRRERVGGRAPRG